VNTEPVPGDVAHIAETDTGLQVLIPAPRNFGASMFLGLWLCGWAAGEYLVLGQLLADAAEGASRLFLFAWLSLWTAGGGMTLHRWLWLLTGRERIVLGNATLAVDREVVGLALARQYDLTNVTNLRVSTTYPSFGHQARAAHFWGLDAGIIAFDYGSATVRFGAGLEPAEANRVCAVLASRRPSLRPPGRH